MDSSDTSNKNFFKHVFNFEDDSKTEMLNIVQYSLLAIIPVVIMNKTMARYVPEADESKGSLEISAEVVVQTVTMFLGLLFVHRMVTYVPTYSGGKYPDFSIILIILSVLVITLSLQTKLGEKVGILVDRLLELWNGKKQEKEKPKTGVRVSQPISGSTQMQMQTPDNIARSQALYNDGTSIGALQQPDFDAMYRKEDTPLVGAFEPVAANDGGVSAFAGW